MNQMLWKYCARQQNLKIWLTLLYTVFRHADKQLRYKIIFPIENSTFCKFKLVFLWDHFEVLEFSLFVP